MAFVGIIDPPSLFDPPEAWRAFLGEMRALPSSPEVDRAIAEAEEVLADVGDEEEDFGDLGDDDEEEDDEEEEAEDAWSEADHPRGQPSNAGQFASSPGAGSSSESTKTTSQSAKPSSGVKAKGLAAAEALKAQWRERAPDTVEALVAGAAGHQAELAAVADQIAAELGVDFKNPGPKSEKRLREKMARGKEPRQITDSVRGGFDVWTPEQADLVAEELGKHFEVADEGWRKTPAGYFDRSVMVRFDDGTVGEVQIWPPGMLDTKEQVAHPLYEAWQRAVPGPEKVALLQKQIAAFAAVCAGLPSVWQSVVNC